jgi:uncharacterized protein
MPGELNITEIDELIRSQIIGRMGCHADGITYVVPISYAYDGNYIYGHTFEGMKISMIRKNPNVCFEVENTKNLANWQTAISWGVLEELADGPDRDQAIHMLESRALPILSSETMHLGPLWPFCSSPEEAVPGIIFRIRVTKKTGRFEKSSKEYFFAT